MGKLKTTEQFIEESKAVHGDKLNYDLVEYTGAKNKVKLKCNKEGHLFEQSPSNNLHGFGCILCARIVQGDSKRKDKEHFLKRACEVHGDTYSYDNVVYVDSKSRVQINCKVHEPFLQTINAHLAGKGCEKCARIYNSSVREDYVLMAKGRDTILYLLKFTKGKEQFYKIGKTYTTIKERYRKNKDKNPYKYEVLHTFVSDALTISDLETSLHIKYGKYNYIPKDKFGGYTECYNLKLPIEEIIKIK